RGELPAETRPLPESYGTGRLWVVARDPHCLYARWDLKPEQQRDISALPTPTFLVLRIFHQGERDIKTAELRVSPSSHHAFIEVQSAGTPYLVELGYYGPNNDWRALATSGQVRTQPEAVSGEKTFRFATFPVERPSAQVSQPVPASTSAAPSRIPTAEPAPEQTGARALIVSAVRSPHLPAALQPDARLELFPGALRPELGETEPPVGAASRVETPVEPGTPWTREQEEALADLIGWMAPWQSAPGSAEFVQAGMPEAGVPGEAAAMSAGVSSFGAAADAAPKGFWLNVNAELVVYGSTVPGTRVTISGRLIQLRPDGTFSYRFTLPDGHFALPIVAVSSEGDLRQADLNFSRSTSCHGEVGAQPQDPRLSSPGPGAVG
ncbi:MAG TPA: DUF4912 domain-containing protein, partial [Verrucomicrobiae bacterium]|nr:DUF4912 domain-containing protein [Verrucomicrobiae bacterium]